MRLTSLEDRIAMIENGAVSVASNSPISFATTSLANALNGFGVLIQKGIAQFNTLVFRQLVASKDADGTSSAGSVTVLSGNTVAQVDNSLVLPSTKVFVTFNTQITGSWWVSDKTVGSFRVVLSAPQATSTSFDYFLVQTEGQIATSTPTVGGNQTPPTVGITLLGDNPFHIAVDGVFTDPGVVASSPYITFINGTEQIVSASTIDTSSPTTYIITYKVTDANGNVSTAVRSVIVGNPDSTVTTTSPPASSDTTVPVVTLIGDAAIQMTLDGTFTDTGATALDAVDGDLTAKIIETGSVDTATAGLYTLTYSATDAAGNTGSVSRVVTVSATPASPTASSTPSI
jgi:hypothetical protein